MELACNLQPPPVEAELDREADRQAAVSHDSFRDSHKSESQVTRARALLVAGSRVGAAGGASCLLDVALGVL